VSYPPHPDQSGPGYRYTSPSWPPQQHTPPAKRRRAGRTVLFVALGIAGVLAAIVGIGALAGGDNKPTSGGEATALTVVSPAAENAEADPGKDLGTGEPGAACATNRLGNSFVKDGVTYVCSKPKPYRWRAVDPYEAYLKLAPKDAPKISREDAQTRALLGCGQDWAPGTVDAALAEAYASLCEGR
jgi:hypothetical protein